MKKILMIAAVLSLVVSAYAQTPEQKQASVDRCAKLTQTKAPTKCGLSDIDNLAAKTLATAVNAATITVVLENLAARANGLNEQGVTDASIAMPTMEECTAMSQKITDQTKDVKSVSDMLPAATDQLKSANAMQKVKATKPLSYSKDMLVIVGEETVYQGQTIAAIVELVKAATK